MKKRKILTLALVAIAIVSVCIIGALSVFAAEEPEAKASLGEIDVYLIAGQSNAVGFGSDGLSATIMNDPRYTDGFENVLYYGVGENNVISELVPVTVGLGKNTTSVGAEVGIAASVGDRQSAVIKHAIGGTYLYPTTDGTPAQNYGTWTSPSYIEKYGVNTNGNKMGDIYEEFVKTVTNGIALLKAEGYTPVVKGIWWMQGEAETPYEARANAYEELLTMLISDMRADVGAIVGEDLSNLPFVMGKIKRNPDPSYTQYEYVDVVNAAQVAVTSKINNTYIVDTSSLKQLDGWHYTADAQHWIGTQFVNAIISADGKYGVTVNGVNVNMNGGGAKSEGEDVTVTFVPYENCTITSVKIKIGSAEAVTVELDATNSYTFTMPAAEVSFEVVCVDPYAIETIYGTIPSRFADEEIYPFVLFKNGEMIDAFENWHTFINANSLTGCTLLMRRNYSTSEGGDAHGLRNTPELTIDLGGFVLTRGNYHLFQAIGKNTTANTTVVRVINGTLKANYYKDGVTNSYATPLIVFNNQASSTVSDTFKFIFDGITIDVSEGRGIVACYNDGTVGSKGEIVLNNCTINRGASTVKMTIFAMEDSGNKNDVSVTINGGKIVADTLSNLVLASSNAPRREGESVPDRIFVGENAPVVELPSSYTVPATAKLNFSDGNYYPLYPSVNEELGKTTYSLVNLSTPYGDINPTYASVTDYPFVLFKNGTMVLASAKWNDLINNQLTKADYKSGCTLVLRRDYNTKEGGDSWNLCNISDFTLDLGGFVFSRGDYHMFQAMGRDAADHVTKVKVINGTLKATNDPYLNSKGETKYPTPLLCFNKNASNTGNDQFEFVFEGVKFDVSAGRGIVASFNDGAGSIDATVTLNNCVIYRGASTATMTLFSLSDTNNNNVDVVINGGELIADKADGLSKLTFAQFSSGTPTPDTFKIENNFAVVMPTSVTIPDKVYTATNASYCLAKTANNDDGTSTYVFLNVNDLATKYGDIKTKYASVLDYPFVLFKSGEAIHAFRDWKVFIDSEAYRTANYQTGCTLLLRRDYSTSEASGDNWAFAYIKDLVIDLGGYTLTRGNRHLFNAISHGTTSGTTSITVMNGTLVAQFNKDDGSATSPVLCFNNDKNSSAVDQYFFTFNNITFDVSTGRGIVNCYTNGGAGSGTNNVITLNDCTIYRGSSVYSTTLFGLKEGGTHKNDISVIINGGKLEANSLRSLTFATYDSERVSGAGSPDSFKFGTEGEFANFEITILTTSTAPDQSALWQTTEGVDCIFVKKSSAEKTTTYTLYPSVMNGYKIKTSITLWSNFVYNVYIPAINFNGVKVNGFAVDYEEVEIDGVVYYHVAVNLPAGKTLSDIALTVTLNTGSTTVDANWTLNVYNYTKAVLEGEFDDTTKTLMKDMLVYATAAHTYFDNTAAVAETLAEINTLLGDYTAALPTGEAKQPTTDTYFTKVEVYVGEVPSFRFYLAEGYTAGDFTFKVGNRIVETKEENGYVEIVMYAYRMLDDVTFTVKGADVTESYNLYAYYAYASTLGNANLTAVVEALMKYSVSATNYRKAVIGA